VHARPAMAVAGAEVRYVFPRGAMMGACSRAERAGFANS